MTRRIEIPGVIDLLRVDDPSEVRALAAEARVGRDLAGPSPVLNRMILGRIREAFRHHRRPFSAVAPRGDPARAERQQRLEADLARRVAAGEIAPDHLDALAAYVRGETHPDAIGPLAQEAVGRLFSGDYRATRATWAAACTIDAAARTMNPIRRAAWALGNALERAQDELARGVGGDPSGLHATGVAVHSLVRSLQAMRALWADPARRDASSADSAAVRALRAPAAVPRRVAARAATALGELHAGTLVLLDLDAARERDPGPAMAFLTGTWSQCPAHAWVLALLRAVWTRAGEGGAR